MKPSLQLKLGQHLTMTPQLQQAIRLLQLSTLELQSEVQQALEENPMLEQDEENFDTSLAAENDSLPSDKQGTASDNDNDSAAENEDPHLDMENNQEMPDELPVDANWEDTYDITTATAPSSQAMVANSSVVMSSPSHSLAPCTIHIRLEATRGKTATSSSSYNSPSTTSNRFFVFSRAWKNWLGVASFISISG